MRDGHRFCRSLSRPTPFTPIRQLPPTPFRHADYFQPAQADDAMR
jgi:hypothetical protein